MQKKGASIRDFSRFRTTYTKARKETPHAERSTVCLSVRFKGPNFEKSQSTNSDGKPSAMSKEKTPFYFLVAMTPF